MGLHAREAQSWGVSIATPTPRARIDQGGRRHGQLRLTKSQQRPQMSIQQGQVRAAAAGKAGTRLPLLPWELAAQVLEGEMSLGDCLFSLARLEAAGSPHSVALIAASAWQTGPVAGRSPLFLLWGPPEPASLGAYGSCCLLSEAQPPACSLAPVACSSPRPGPGEVLTGIGQCF